MTSWTTEQHILIIPRSGLVEVIHTDDDVDLNAILVAKNTEVGHLIRINVEVDGVPAEVYYTTSDLPNVRAQDVFHRLSGAYAVLTGAVIFKGLPHDLVYEFVRDLSVRERDVTPRSLSD